MFNLLKIDTSFLKTNRKLWFENPVYLKIREIIKCIPVVNNASERALGLFTEFHDKLTLNPASKLNILKIIKQLREKQAMAVTSTERVTKKGMKLYV